MNTGLFENISNNDAVIKQVDVDSTTVTIVIELWDNKMCEIRCSGVCGFKGNSGIGQDIGSIEFNRESDFFCEITKAEFGNMDSVPNSVQSMIICEAFDDTPILEVVAAKFEVVGE